MVGSVSLSTTQHVVGPTLLKQTKQAHQTPQAPKPVVSDQLNLMGPPRASVPATTITFTPPSADEAGVTYTVKAGDTLGTIAAEHLGGSRHWKKLYEMNQDRLSNPNQISPGMVLKLTDKNPQIANQLNQLAQKYNVTIPEGKKATDMQSTIAKAVITAMAEKHGVPVYVAMGVGGHESGGWKMWKDPEVGALIKGENKSNSGRVFSTDWGVMQINDKYHPQAFPSVKDNMESNIEYGVKFLANLHNRAHGSLGIGFGEWDRTIAAYNLGHSPYKSELAHANHYVSSVKRWALRSGSMPRIQENYTVKSGDTLGTIARHQLGDVKRWTEIFELNKEQVPAPEKLRVGVTLTLPAK